MGRFVASIGAIAALFFGAVVIGLREADAWDPQLLRADARPRSGDAPKWRVHRLPKEHFTIALPRGWLGVGRDPASRLELARFRRANPEWALRTGSLLGGNPAIKFRALDGHADKDAVKSDLFVTNVNVLRGRAAGSPSATWRQNLLGIRTIPALKGAVQQEWFATAAGKAREFQYTLRVRRPPAHPLVLAITQYSVVAGRRNYVLTYATTEAQRAAYANTFRQSAATFRVT